MSTLPRFRHLHSHSLPSLASPLAPPSPPRLPRIVSSSPPPASPDSEHSHSSKHEREQGHDRPRPPTPHRGYSLAVPSSATPGQLEREKRHADTDPSSASSHAQRGRSASVSEAATHGSDAGGPGDGERGRRLKDVRSRETIRSVRTTDGVSFVEGGSEMRRRGPSPAPTAASASPIDFHDIVQIYQIVAARRANFDLLLWSVPSTSSAAQAFLFQTALAGDSSRTARIVSMALSLLITLLTLQLFTRQLQAEAADHAWLEVLITAAIEKTAFVNCQN
ncbi:hypothetical protein JCM10207_004670 [Rhodosporidiobolus poonsookiae]